MRCRPLASRVMVPSLRREDALRISQLLLRATGSSDESSSTEDDEPLAGFREKLPNLLELVKVLFKVISKSCRRMVMGYSGWFAYRYLLFKENGDELANEIDSLEKKITGNEE